MQDFFQRSEITLRYLLEDSNVDLRYCEICDDIIPQGRVNAIPETRYCVTHAQSGPEGKKNRTVEEPWGTRADFKKDSKRWNR